MAASRRVLVVEPDAARKAALLRALPPELFDVTWCADLISALSAAATTRPDAAIVPGPGISRGLRAAWPRLAILLCDPRYKDTETARNDCRSGAADSAIPLPCDLALLDTRLDEARAIAEKRREASTLSQLPAASTPAGARSVSTSSQLPAAPSLPAGVPGGGRTPGALQSSSENPGLPAATAAPTPPGGARSTSNVAPLPGAPTPSSGARAASFSGPLPAPADTSGVTKLPRPATDASLRVAGVPAPVAIPTTGAHPSVKAGWDAFRARIEDLHKRLDALDYYQVLGVEAGASMGQIKTAFYARAMELHPDRFLTLKDDALKEKIYQAFKRISEAFKVLSSSAQRAEYDANLKADRGASLRYVKTERPKSGPRDPADIAKTAPGRKYVSQALVAEREKNLSAARTYLSLAQQAEPDNESIKKKLEEIRSREKG